MKPISQVDEAKRLIESFDGSPRELVLPIADELQDPVGVNIAIITDSILAKGWEPDGFDQRDGFRIYHYKSWDSEAHA